MGKVVVINEAAYKRLFENVTDTASVTPEMMISICVWCIMNDFLMYNPNVMFGRPIINVNDDNTKKEVIKMIMNSFLELDNDRAQMFGDEDDVISEYNIYRIPKGKIGIFIEVSNDIDEEYADDIFQKVDNGEIEDIPLLDDFRRNFE